MVASSPASSPASTYGATFTDRLAAIHARMGKAAREASRDSPGVVLTAVSKTQSPEAIDAALAAGLRVFGENRVQEAEARWVDRRAAFPDLELRLIGPLQSNKAAIRLGATHVRVGSALFGERNPSPEPSRG
jgi:uncharacterized pyridoxal phosphate-containing UPF0001 family protein